MKQFPSSKFQGSTCAVKIAITEMVGVQKPKNNRNN